MVWNFAGTKQFISQREQLASHGWLVDLLTAVEGQDRKAMLAAIETARFTFHAAKKTK